MLPFLFTALKVGATLAFIGAIVGEYFGGTSDVLGRVVLTAMSSGSYDLAWAGILIGAIGAIVAYVVISALERVVNPVARVTLALNKADDPFDSAGLSRPIRYRADESATVA